MFQKVKGTLLLIAYRNGGGRFVISTCLGIIRLNIKCVNCIISTINQHWPSSIFFVILFPFSSFFFRFYDIPVENHISTVVS